MFQGQRSTPNLLTLETSHNYDQLCDFDDENFICLCDTTRHEEK